MLIKVSSYIKSFIFSEIKAAWTTDNGCEAKDPKRGGVVSLLSWIIFKPSQKDAWSLSVTHKLNDFHELIKFGVSAGSGKLLGKL